MSGHGHLTVLGMLWSREDPLAVRLTLSAQPDHPALPRGEWAVLREFLRYGIEEPTGDGDVRIRPEADGRVRLELLGEAKPYAVHVPAGILRNFLYETETIVAPGARGGEGGNRPPSAPPPRDLGWASRAGPGT